MEYMFTAEPIISDRVWEDQVFDFEKISKPHLDI
jgi:hypothetical protein